MGDYRQNRIPLIHFEVRRAVQTIFFPLIKSQPFMVYHAQGNIDFDWINCAALTTTQINPDEVTALQTDFC